MQTKYQFEWQDQSMDQYRRALYRYDQANWGELLPQSKYVYNNSVNLMTQITPFRAM